MVERQIPSGKTRLKLVLLAIAWICAERAMGNIEFLPWLEGIKWAIGIYGITEIGAKASHAYMNKGQ